MRLLREGRASQIFDLGDGTVLRRYKRAGAPYREAEFMRVARQGGVACPHVFEVLPDGLVLERIEGMTMHEHITVDPSPRALAAAASELAALHNRLHAITRDGAALIHRDLHWKNVIQSDAGPVLLDWSNAGWGDAHIDTALTWIILATSSGKTGRHLAEDFGRFTDTQTSRHEAATYRLADATLTEQERELVRAMLARVNSGPGSAPEPAGRQRTL